MGFDALEPGITQIKADQAGMAVVVEGSPHRHRLGPETAVGKADREAARVLRPGAPIAISFSNRCFWTKAVAVWRALDGDGHARLVDLYLRRAGFADVEIRRLTDGRASDPLTVVTGRAGAAAPWSHEA